jgi:hypothetical protein
MADKTISETLFEQFCDENHVAWHRIPVAGLVSRKTPDYRIECANNIVIVEVKEFGDSPEDRMLRERLRSQGATGAFDPKLDQRVRNKIDAAMPQLRQLAKNRYPAMMVLYDDVTLLPIEGLEIRLAMYGQDHVDVGVTGSSSSPILVARHHFGGGRRVTDQHNTTLSAIALLTVEKQGIKHIAVYHNKYAAIPFQPVWLNTSAVDHYRIGDRPQAGGLIGWERVSIPEESA